MLRRSLRPAAFFLFFLLFSLAAGLPAFAADGDWQSGLDALKQGRLDVAEKHFRQVAADKPDWYGGHRMLGQVLLRLDRPAEALKSLEKAHAVASGDAATRYDLGRAALAAKDPAKALEALAGPRPDALPDAAWNRWLRYRAEASRRQGNLDSARQDLEVLAGADPRDADLQFLLYQLNRDLGRDSAAQARLRQASELAPDNPLYLSNRLVADHRSASSLEGDERADRCRTLQADAGRLVELDASASSLKVAAAIHGCAGSPERSAALLARAVAEGDDSWDTAFRLGRRLSGSGAPEKALPVLTELLGRTDESRLPQVYGELGYAFQLTGAFDRAVDAYRKAGDTERARQAEEAKAVHLANLQEEERYRKEQELLDKLRNLDKQAKEAGGRL